MSPAEVVMTETKKVLSGKAIISALKQADVPYVLSVPDNTTSSGLLFPIASDPDFRLVRVCKDDEAVGISAAMSYCGMRSLILIQNTGFFDSINAIRAVAVEYKLPVVMMIGLLSKEPDIPASESSVYSVRIVEPILQAMGIDYAILDNDADIERIQPAIETAYSRSHPFALLVARVPSP
jgi:sulfopyruvate decarboxylase TPP-binding subunit